MVDKTENNEPAPRKRMGLFGTRRSKAIEASVVAKPNVDAESLVDTAAQYAPEQPAEVSEEQLTPFRSVTSVLFQAPDLPVYTPRTSQNGTTQNDGGQRDGGQRDGGQRDDRDDDSTTVRRRSRRRSGEEESDASGANPPNTVLKVRTPRPQAELITEPQRIKGSTRLEAKKQRRRDGRDAGRRRPVITEAEFLARRESVDRMMVVRSKFGRTQIGVVEDGVLVEHYVAKAAEASLIGNVYLGRVQNVLPSMEAAFVDIGRGRNAVLYSGEVDWDAAAESSSGGNNQARRIELALKPGDTVLVQVTKDPIGHKGARLTSQVSLPGRYLVYVPNGTMNGISRKLPDTERARLKKILKEVLPENVGVIVRTAAEGATDEQLTLDVNRLTSQWAAISETIAKVQGPALLHSEPDLLVKIVRDVFNEDFQKLVIEGEDAESTISTYLGQVAPDLIDRIETYTGKADSFDEYRISEQIEKALDRKVWLPSGGSLVIDRTEAMTVVDVNTGKFVGSGGNLEETVTKNNLEAAEEIVRQLRLRDIGGIIVVDFIDMVLESNRDLVLRRLVECLSRDRTKHQVAEVTSLGLIQMTRKKLGLGLIESFSENCEACAGRGIIIQHDSLTKHRQTPQPETPRRGRKPAGGASHANGPSVATSVTVAKASNGTHAITDDARNALAKIATSTIAHLPEVAAVAVAEAESAAPNSNAPSSNAPSSNAPSSNQSRQQRGRGGSQQRARAEQRAANTAASEIASPVELTPDAVSESLTPDATGRGFEKRAETAASGAKVPMSVEEVVATVAEAAIAILDIPLNQQVRAPRKISTKDAEQILDSVLDALPEPRLPGQGRGRVSRRASSAGTVTVAKTGDSE